MQFTKDMKVMCKSPVRLLATLFACFGTGTMSANAQVMSLDSEFTEITVCTQEWEGDTNADGSGLYWEMFDAVFEPVGVKITAKFMPHKVSIAKIRNKSCDIAMGGYMNEFADVLYTDWPHEVEAVFALHSRDVKFSDVRSFKGKKSAWLQDYGFQLLLPAGIDFREVRNEVVGLLLLERGTIDYFVDYEVTMQKAASQAGLDLSNFAITPVPELSKPVYPMFRHDERGTKLVKLFDRRMNELHDSGTLDLMFERNGLGPYPAPRD
jgi:polar amino acid transport system substrate-binding protein